VGEGEGEAGGGEERDGYSPGTGPDTCAGVDSECVHVSVCSVEGWRRREGEVVELGYW